MRFLDTTVFVERGVLEFKYIENSELHTDSNAYAILSHRWGNDEDEVTYLDITSAAYHHKLGRVKLSKFCEIAAASGCRYGWADTCCIDKTNSSELTEAINSMFNWYSNSKMCIAYLKDTHSGRPMLEDEWFTRGWTLQELIAPKILHFYAHDWTSSGTKQQHSKELAEATGVPQDILTHTVKLSTCSVAQRISWTARRQTKREEDRACSLMGLLDVNMPTIYGEGKKAFVRLQRAIMQQSKDESLFAWEMEFEDGNIDTDLYFSGLLASSPDAFVNCGGIIDKGGSRGFSEANGEIAMRSNARACGSETFCVILNCGSDNGCNTGIFARRTSLKDEDEYVRVTNFAKGGRDELVILDETTHERLIRVPVQPLQPPLHTFNGFWLRSLLPPRHNRSIMRTSSRRPQSHESLVVSKQALIAVQPPE